MERHCARDVHISAFRSYRNCYSSSALRTASFCAYALVSLISVLTMYLSQVNIPRSTYFAAKPHETIRDHFAASLPSSGGDLWLEYNSVPLRWYAYKPIIANLELMVEELEQLLTRVFVCNRSCLHGHPQFLTFLPPGTTPLASSTIF